MWHNHKWEVTVKVFVIYMLWGWNCSRNEVFTESLSSKRYDCKMEIIMMMMVTMMIIAGLFRGLLWEPIIDGWTAVSILEGRYYVNSTSFSFHYFSLKTAKKDPSGWIRARIEGGKRENNSRKQEIAHLKYFLAIAFVLNFIYVDT